MSDYKRDDGTVIEVEYDIEQRGYPSNGWDDAGEPTIVALTQAWEKERGRDVQLLQCEIDRIEGEIAEMLDREPYDDPMDDLYVER